MGFGSFGFASSDCWRSVGSPPCWLPLVLTSRFDTPGAHEHLFLFAFALAQLLIPPLAEVDALRHLHPFGSSPALHQLPVLKDLLLGTVRRS